ncbi:MAG: TonB-dependent receptor [Tannerellaceae bacterium]|jgi:TonB-linked SusC/RagA family outer membrane protein|nr:TonB-dependent receptor [Tannerellaceae bacterium]
MKLTGLFLFLSISAVFAIHSYAQETALNISTSEKTVSDVLDAIEEQSDFHFFYNNKLVDINREVSLHAVDKDVFSILNQLFADSNIRYKVIDKDIILTVNESNGITQNKKILTGIVTDLHGEPIIGANVVEKGTTNGTVTDMDGKYSLDITANATLVISYIGYITKEILTDSRTNYNIELIEDSQALDEVVVVGYGTMKKSDLTGSISNVKAEKLLDKPSVNIGQALSGKAAGVEIFENGGDPDGKIRIRIRGDNSINSSNDPLYVVDGIIGVSGINLLNPGDIESLEVLKDASATAIYGARGANGVIMITTKRGFKSDKPVISYDGYLSVGHMARKLPLMNASEWWQTYNTTMDNAAKYNPEGYAQGKYEKISTASLPKLFDSSGNPIYDTDWQDEAYRTTTSHNHQVSARGGGEKLLYSAHLSYMHKEALLKNNYLDRFSGRLNMDSELRSWLKMGINMSYNHSSGNNLYNHYGIKRLIQEAIPIIPVKYPDGSWGSNRDFPGAVQDTPSRYLEEMTKETTNSHILSDIYLDFILTKELNFKSTFAIDVLSRKTNEYSGKELIQYSKTQGGIANINTSNQLYWQNENYLNWNKQLNPSNRLNVMVGLSWQKKTVENVGNEVRNFSDDFYQWHNLGAGTVVIPPTSEDSQWAINSYFARFNYNLLERYLFTATGRYDGSSKFGKNNKYAFFPSFAFAWRASEENFLKNNEIINNLKFRASIGLTGNQEIGNYKFLQNLASGNVIFGDNYYSALYRSTFGNPDLKWEKTMQSDMGFDISILNQRIELTADYYFKNTSDLLLNAPIPNTSGLSTIMRNIGSVRNQGIDLTLHTHNIKTNDFNWMSTILFNKNKNKVTKLGANDEDIFPGPNHPQGQFTILRVGEPVGALWGLTRLGTWSENEAEEAAKYGRLPGDIKFADLNNDGKINNDDNSIIGYSSPKWTLSFSNTFVWKNLDFSFDIRIVQGHNVVNASTHNAEDRSGVANGFKTNLDAWTPSNQNTMVAERRPMSSYYDSYPDTHWMQDGSFIRGQNFMLGYNFNQDILRKLKIENLRIYMSAQNLFCITKYKGYDPEVTTNEGAAFGQGIDDFSEPKARTYTIGLNIKF